MKTHLRGRGKAAGDGQEQTQQRETIMRLPDSVGSVVRAGLLGLAVAACAAPGVVWAQSAAAADAAATNVTVDVGTQQLLRQRLPIRRVAVANPEIADVSVINSRELLINGKATGVTSLIIWSRDAKAQPLTYKVSVSSRSIGGSTADLLAHRDAVLAAGSGACRRWHYWRGADCGGSHYCGSGYSGAEPGQDRRYPAHRAAGIRLQFPCPQQCRHHRRNRLGRCDNLRRRAPAGRLAPSSATCRSRVRSILCTRAVPI